MPTSQPETLTQASLEDGVSGWMEVWASWTYKQDQHRVLGVPLKVQALWRSPPTSLVAHDKEPQVKYSYHPETPTSW